MPPTPPPVPPAGTVDNGSLTVYDGHVWILDTNSDPDAWIHQGAVTDPNAQAVQNNPTIPRAPGVWDPYGHELTNLKPTRRHSKTSVVKSNPPFMINNNGLNPFTGKLWRGWIEAETPITHPLRKQEELWRCNFMFNPSVISAGYGIQTSKVPANQSDVGLDGFTNARSWSLDLLFDRSLDIVNASSKKPANWQEAIRGGIEESNMIIRGVQTDIEALEHTLGIVTEGYGLTHNMIKVFLTPTVIFRGYVDGLSVTYTHFTHNMTPRTAVANLSLVMNFTNVYGELADTDTEDAEDESDAPQSSDAPRSRGGRSRTDKSKATDAAAGVP